MGQINLVCNNPGPPLGLLQDGCTGLFLGKGAQFRTSAWRPFFKIDGCLSSHCTHSNFYDVHISLEGLKCTWISCFLREIGAQNFASILPLYIDFKRIDF